MTKRTQYKIGGIKSMEKYIARCRKKLKEWGAPLEYWKFVEMIDEEDANFKCELCGCEKVRYVHVMEHNEYFEKVYVGCICAGIMEGDIIAAQERDRKMKNRAKRKLNFPHRRWKETRVGELFIKYHGKYVFINHNGRNYYCTCDGNRTWQYKGKPINDFLSACYAAFDLADPIEEAIR